MRMLLILLILSSCKSPQWAYKKMSRVEAFQPVILSKYCGSRFPPAVYDSTRVEFAPGVPVVFRDTVRDTLKNAIISQITQRVYQRDTITVTQVKQVENKAAIESLTRENLQLQVSEQTLIERHRKARSMAIWLGLTLVVMVIWKIANWFRWIRF